MSRSNTPDHPTRCPESVWDFPRPARIEPVRFHLKVAFAGRVIAETRSGYRAIETSHPPSYYFPPADVDMTLIIDAAKRTMCEWKGGAVYHDIVADGRQAKDAAWSYPRPEPAFRAVANYLAFYAGRVDAATVDGEPAVPQAGDFYGGWITSHVAGPFKGPPGTMHW